MAASQTLTLADRLALADAAHSEGRIIQNSWRKQADGRELVCALAAFGPDINSASDCPADLMPTWLAHLVPAIDDGVAPAQVPWFSGALIARAHRWHVLDDAAWERIRIGFLIAGIKQAIAAASAVHQDNPPAYWPQVTSACDQVCAALQTGQGLKEAEAAAEAAAVAAVRATWAAEAAARAAWAAARAARAARAAARAARAAEAAARATWAAARAAEAAAWKSLAETLFALIDVELDIAEAVHV